MTELSDKTLFATDGPNGPAGSPLFPSWPAHTTSTSGYDFRKGRQLLWFAVTKHPTAEWLAQQIVEAFPWDTAPSYLIRDKDGAYGRAFTNRVRAMGIRDRPIAPRSPWQNPYVERLIGGRFDATAWIMS